MTDIMNFFKNRFVSILFLITFLLCPNSYGQSESKIYKKKPLRIGYSMDRFTDVNIKEAKLALSIWMDKISIMQKYEADNVIFDDLDAFVDALKNKEVEIVNLITTDYLKIEDLDLVEPVLTPVINNDPHDIFILLVNKNSGIDDISKLKGRHLITEFGGRNVLPLMWLDTILLKKGQKASKEHFKTITKAKNSSKAVLPVFFGQVEACITDLKSFNTLIELNPQLGEELVILEKSPKLITYITCFRKDFYPEDKEIIINNAVGLQKSTGGKQILMLMQIDGVMRLDSSHLDSVRSLVREYKQLTGGTAKSEQ